MLTNTSSLGVIHLVDMRVEPSLLNTTDCALMSDSVDYREPENSQESLLCAKAPKWRRARKRERDALFERNVMRVVSTPPGARPLSRGTYTSVSTARWYIQSRSIRHA